MALLLRNSRTTDRPAPQKASCFSGWRGGGGLCAFEELAHNGPPRAAKASGFSGWRGGGGPFGLLELAHDGPRRAAKASCFSGWRGGGGLCAVEESLLCLRHPCLRELAARL